MLRFASARGIADVHFKPAQRPLYRRFGQLISRRDEPAFTADELAILTNKWLPADQLNQFQRCGDATFVITLVGCGRFRVSCFQARGNTAWTVRVISARILNLRELNLPRFLGNWAMLRHGLVLVSAPPGGGKTATWLALLEHINTASATACQIVTLEAPVEQQFDDKVAFIHQREVGSDTQDVASGIRAAQRQSPDVIGVDVAGPHSLIDLLDAAELDMLVIASVTGGGAVDVLRKLLDSQTNNRQVIRQRLARRLRGIVHQQLVATADGKGMVPICEVLHMVPQTAEYLKSDRDIDGLQALIDSAAHRAAGMVGFDHAIGELVHAGTVSAEVGLAVARDAEGLRPKLSALRPSSSPADRLAQLAPAGPSGVPAFSVSTFGDFEPKG